MKKFYPIIFCLFFGTLLATQPGYAKLAPTYEQAVIMIKQVSGQTIVAADGSVYKAGTSEILNQARRFGNRPVRILYMVSGKMGVITVLQPDNGEPLKIPKPPKQIPGSPH